MFKPFTLCSSWKELKKQPLIQGAALTFYMIADLHLHAGGQHLATYPSSTDHAKKEAANHHLQAAGSRLPSS